VQALRAGGARARNARARVVQAARRAARARPGARPHVLRHEPPDVRCAARSGACGRRARVRPGGFAAAPPGAPSCQGASGHAPARRCHSGTLSYRAGTALNARPLCRPSVTCIERHEAGPAHRHPGRLPPDQPASGAAARTPGRLSSAAVRPAARLAAGRRASPGCSPLRQRSDAPVLGRGSGARLRAARTLTAARPHQRSLACSAARCRA